MAFKSYENTGSNNSNVMVEGDYEVQCVSAMETQTRTSHVPCIAFDFVVRDDVDQRYKKKHIFKNFYKDENGNWPVEKIGKYANAMGIEKGAEFEVEELCGLCCIVHMKLFTGNDGVERDCIFYTAPTKAGQLIQSAPIGNGFTTVDEDESDLPF